MIKIKDVPYVGPKTLSVLYEEGIQTPNDMLFRFPKKYESFKEDSLLLAVDKTTVTVVGEVVSIPVVISHKYPLKSLQFKLLVDHEIYKVIAYRREFLKDQLKENMTIQVKGQFFKKRKTINASQVILKPLKTELKPIYGYEGLYDSNVSKIIGNIYSHHMAKISETLPIELIKKRGLLDCYDMVHQLHFPKSEEKLKEAFMRLKYEEALKFQLQLMQQKIAHEAVYKVPKEYDLKKVKAFINDIPYELTQDQKKAVNDVFKDFKKPHVVKRLIQGDVGSGKTVVVGIAMYGAKTAGYQSAIMAPTEILAQQHYETFQKMFPKLTIALLTASTKKKKQLKDEIKQGKIDLIIGTHALITDDTEFHSLGFVVIDEQHRFGVLARETLEKKGIADIVYLTATPIPRTLAIVLFGDMEISNIKQMPVGRKSIVTTYFVKNQTASVFNHVQLELEKGHNAYFVAPSIESESRGESVYSIYEMAKKYFLNRHIFILHGKISGQEKQDVMLDFHNTKGSILVSTSVVEVGLDVKNATVMVIFDAEYFGLSQLHQLRGRVGRSDAQSYCYVISDDIDKERLKTFETVEDGFILSEYDLENRGPGEFLGVRQSGIVDFKYTNIAEDFQTFLEAKEDALWLLKTEEDNKHYLKSPEIKKTII